MQESPLLPHHRARGATLSNSSPPLVLAHSEPPEEYRAARERCVVFDQTDRGRLDVRGADATVFLQRLTSNELRKLAPGQGARNLLLSSKGKVLFDFDVEVERDGLRLSTPPGQAAALLKALDTYLFSEKVVITDATARHAPIALCGPAAPPLLSSALGVDFPARDHDWIDSTFEGGPLRVVRMPVAGSDGVRLDAGPEQVGALWRALITAGAAPAGRIVYDSLRVEAGQAEPGVDIDDNVYPQEARLERAFSLDKGCYIGQEVVAKIDTYGGLNKRLVALSIEHDDPLPRGARLWREEDGEWRDVGVCTSWAYSFALDTGLALAYVKRRRQAPGQSFVVGAPDAPLGRATIVALPVRPDAVAVTGEFE